jgi:SAM-dependent methyltransferase
MKTRHVHYGCGAAAPREWENFDVSPTLRIQRTPVLGWIMRNFQREVFPREVRYGDITKGLPVPDDSCDGIYCSHVLEHLALDDFRKALRNTYRILKPGGLFRCVLPDLEWAGRRYVRAMDNGETDASLHLMSATLLGLTERPKGLKGLVVSFWGNSHHLWMWDRLSLAEELRKAGFSSVRACAYHDSADRLFELVENEERFKLAIAFECTK